MIDQTKMGVMIARTMESVERQLEGHHEFAVVQDALVVVTVKYGPEGQGFYADVGCTSAMFHIKLGLLQTGIFAVTGTTPFTPGGPANE